jgi:uncharacterized protein (TIGR00730 family)
MEAANRGAFEVGARSIGLNITLPHEQAPNPYMCPDLAFRFHYFALRKMHFLLHAKGLVAFPGGYGTLDELFEVLTLIQTGKMQRIPVVLVGRAFWRRVVDFDLLLDEGYVSSSDLDLFTCVDEAEEIVSALERFYVNRAAGWGNMIGIGGYRWSLRGTKVRQPMQCATLLIAGALFSPISAFGSKSRSLQILLLLARAIPALAGRHPASGERFVHRLRPQLHQRCRANSSLTRSARRAPSGVPAPADWFVRPLHRLG